MSRRKQQFVWVVMANDFPEHVFSTEDLADDFCMQANSRDKAEAKVPGVMRTRIYYRWYKMELRVES